MVTDDILYRRYLSGDEDGLSALMERHGDKLTLYLDGCLHDLHESEDGKYLIMANGSRTFAIPNGDAPEYTAPEKMTVLVVEPMKEQIGRASCRGRV